MQQPWTTENLEAHTRETLKFQKTRRVQYLEHLISVHGQRPQDAPSFDHGLDHTRGDWGHVPWDYFTIEELER